MSRIFFVVCLWWVSGVPFTAAFADPPVPAPDPALAKTLKAYNAFTQYLAKTESPDVWEMEKLAQDVEEEAQIVVADTGIKDAVKEEAAAYSIVAHYHCAARVNALLPKLKNVISNAVAKFPGSNTAALGEGIVLMFEASADSKTFLGQLDTYHRKYPKSEMAADLAIAYAQMLQITEGAADVKGFVDDAIKILGPNPKLLTFRTGLDSVGKVVELTGPALDGTTFDIKNWKGKVVVIDFWATWCGPCKAMTPSLLNLYADFHSKGVEIVGVSLDSNVDDLKTYLKGRKIAWPQIFFSESKDRIALANKFGVSAIPSLIVVGKDGKVSAMPVHRFEQVETAVADELKK